MTADYPDLVATLSEVRRRLEGDRQIWCVAGTSFETSVTTRRALLLGGVWCPQFLQDDLNPWVVTLERPRLLAIDSVVGTLPEWLPLFEGVAQSNESLLVVTGHIDEELLAVMLVNASRKSLHTCVIRSGTGRPENAESTKVPKDIRRLPKGTRAICRKDATAVFFDDESSATGLSAIEMIHVGGCHAADQRARLAFVYQELSHKR